MISLSRQLTETDSLYNNPTEDGGSTKTAPSIKSAKSASSSAASVRSGTNSTKSRSTTKSKSSTNSVPKTANWKAAVDPLGMSTKAVGPGFMPMFSTNLYAPGFQMPTSANAGAPKAHQSRQLKFVEKKRTGPSSSGASTKSGKSGKSEKTAVSSSNKSVKSVKSTTSSSKSTFLSSFSGTSTQPTESSSSSNKEDKAGAKKSTVTKDKDSAYASDSKPSSTTTISEPVVVVVEDHSSSTPTAQSYDKSALSPTASDRRPSLAESLHLQPYQQTPHTPNELLLKRVISWEYLGQVHNGKMAYYNTVWLTEADLRKFYTPEVVQKRTHQCFLLGTSIANVLDIPHLSDYAKSLSALLHEYEHFLSSETKSKMNFFKGGRRIADGRSFEETGEYIYLEVRTVPFEMDYTVVFATLCEMIAQAYKKFDTHKSSIIIDSDVFHKIDTRLKKLSNNVAKELEILVRDAMQEELNALDPVGSLMMDWDQQAMALGH
ncbi:hypothetical protein BGZ68_010306 [Mortierella alpina]|nr:hypothetical protein BGZ68_010306 [Mortierella alpina]